MSDTMNDERAIELLRFAIKRSKDSMAALTHIAARLAQKPAAAVPDNVTRTAPAKIWLQVDADDYQESRDAAFQSFNDECSWCSESQGGVEIGYIRADLCAQALASNAAAAPDIDLRLQFSISFMDGWLEGEAAEAVNHWERVKAQALASNAGVPEVTDGDAEHCAGVYAESAVKVGHGSDARTIGVDPECMLDALKACRARLVERMKGDKA